MKVRTKGIAREAIVEWLDRELEIASIEDISCNGLQVEGAATVYRVGMVVDACLDAYTAAAENGCQMVIAHHGLIWKGLTAITGPVYRQIKFLCDATISLYAAHLPLDSHATLGNNAQIARMLKLGAIKPFGNYHGTSIGFEGVLKKAVTAHVLAQTLDAALGGRSVVLPFGKKQIKRIGIVSGSAGELIQEGIDKGIDCYITGESKHEHHHMAKEGGLNVIYSGHYHTEKTGVMALGKALERQFGIESIFLDIETLV